MVDAPLVSVGAEGWRRDGAPWRGAGSWVGTLDLVPGDRRAELLAVAARARDEALEVVRVEAPPGDPERALAVMATAAAAHGPRGLLLGEAWQEAAAARCQALTGAAADLGLVDAVRIDDEEHWQGHHLLAGACEIFLAQVWPESAGALRQAVVLGDGPTALAAALVAARRGAATVTLVVPDQDRADTTAARVETLVNWPAAVSRRVVARLEDESPREGIWLRATADDVADDRWLPDAAGDEPCLIVDLAGATTDAPLGFVQPATGGVAVLAAGLAAAWYLGPPVPWDALTDADAS